MKDREDRAPFSAPSHTQDAPPAEKPKNKPVRRRARRRRPKKDRLRLLSRVPNLLKPTPYVRENWVRFTIKTFPRWIERVILGAKFSKHLWNVRFSHCDIAEGYNADTGYYLLAVTVFVRPDIADYCTALADDCSRPEHYLEMSLENEADMALEPLGLDDWMDLPDKPVQPLSAI